MGDKAKDIKNGGIYFASTGPLWRITENGPMELRLTALSNH